MLPMFERALPAVAALLAMCAASPVIAQSAGGKGTTACALLTKALVMEVTPETDKAALAQRLRTPPEEHLLGANRSLCDYAGLTLHLNPFNPTTFEASMGKDKNWVRVPALGDAAWFHDVKGFMGELYVRSGTRTLGVVLEIPAGRTADSIRPNAIAFAKAILARPW